MLLRSHATNHVGQREHNEDAFLALDDRGIYAVADGMGGHAAGEVASRSVIHTLQHWSGRGPRSIVHTLEAVFVAAHAALLRDIAQNPARRGMGTTFTAAVINGDQLNVAHVGDSACYLLRGGKAKRLTEDQSVGHRLLNCLGSRADAFTGAQLGTLTLRQQDRVVLASDGLTNYLATDQELAEVTAPFLRRSAQKLAEALGAYALNAGGHDNITVVAIAIE